MNKIDVERILLVAREAHEAINVITDLAEGYAVDKDSDAALRTFYWSRFPGNFVDKTTGESVPLASWNGSVREWYETLIETVIDLINTVERAGVVLNDGCSLVTNETVGTILEASVLFKPIGTAVSIVRPNGRRLGRIGASRPFPVDVAVDLPNEIRLIYSPVSWLRERKHYGRIVVLDIE